MSKTYWDIYEMHSKHEDRLWKLRQKSTLRLTNRTIDDFCQAVDENAELRSYILNRA